MPPFLLGGIEYFSLDLGLSSDRFPFLPELDLYLGSNAMTRSRITSPLWISAGKATTTVAIATTTTMA